MDSKNGSGSSKHSETHLKVINRSGSSRHSETHPWGIDASGSSNHSETEIFYGTGSITKHLEIHPEITGGNGSSKHWETHPEFIDRSDSSQCLTIDLDYTVNDDDLFAPIKKFWSSSSSPSDSSQEDLCQVDTNEVIGSRTCPPSSRQPDEDARPALKVDVSSNNSSKLDERDGESPGITSMSPVSDVTHESVVQGVSPTQSPPIQVMDRSERHEGYDPYRIPSSVFERRSSTPMDWSVASNESLFSIHVGNNSFSRDHVHFLAGELGKSRELTKSGELIVLSPSLPVPLVETDRNSVKLENKLEASGVADNTIKDETRANLEDQSKEKLPPLAVSWNSSRISHSRGHSHHSDGSETSKQSFAFPIKKRKKCAWPSCCCSNCSWAFCYCWNCSCKRCYCWNCTWPSRYFRWPSCYFRRPSCYCSNCSWAFCYCWNCSHKRWCCCSSIMRKSGSVKVDAEQQHLPPPPSKKISNPAKPTNNCIPCFSCWLCSSCRPCSCKPCSSCKSRLSRCC